MVQNQNGQEQANVQPVNLYTWRLNRAETERREENVNREIMRRQFAH